ncbi:solute carrier organic anion transporter family member 4C1-like isoform X2 [Zootermopsis nevadensis]|uniref:Solute carrier organic anion transporter family member n=1 Tax=Zootermopsis nevadensis TaxID=136037 RepID=A0A067RFP8_ZOONE|nr:solute carrier organic anion transporter family member 4C1-like isoform X2 [Zootermopsis nevadensis]KDR21873.1 Solute carrier organic anion transporter family member 4C1 [Zootermopsis nevadensis]
MDSQPAIYLQQETRTVLPKSTMQNGSSSEVNCKSHQFPVSKNHVSSACPNLVKVSEVDSNNTKQMGPSGVQEEFQPLEVETEQDQNPDQPLKRPDGWEEFEHDTKCGIGGYEPQWLQKLASKKSYVLMYGLIGMFHLIIGSYFVATISTIEKRFKIPSRTSGLITSAVDIAGLFSSFLISYLGNRGHKTRWVASGTLLVGLSCFMRLVPHLIFGPGQDALELTEEYGTSHHTAVGNFSSINEDSQAFVCRSEYEDEEDCSVDSLSSIPSIIFFVSFLIHGIGTCAYYNLGMSYLDDNIRKNKTPILLAIWQCIRMLGPTIGYLYGSYALQKYVAVSVHPTITIDDPRWIGAWWHAWGPFGVMCLILALMFALFPKKLPRAAQRTMAEVAEGKLTNRTTGISFFDFKMVLRRLTKNKVLLFNSFSSVFYMFGLTGYWTFMPKYMETQFRQSASRSSLLTGTVGLICSALGIMASGAVISKFKPRPHYLAGWNVIVEAMDVIGHFSYSFLSCTVDDLHGDMKPDHSWDLIADCNTDCDCGPTLKYSPVCAIDGSNTFYSACHAGCTTLEIVNGTKMYGNCSCIGSEGMGWAVDGACQVDCSTNFTIFLVTLCIMQFLSASGRAGNTIIQFRCVDQDDKSMSIGFTEALLCALAFIPGPIVYGVLLDSACIVWGQTCGETGNCWLYDGQRLGFLLNFTASGFLLGGTLLDIGVWYNVKDLQIYDKEVETGNMKKKKTKKNTREEQERIDQLNEPCEFPLL